MVILTCLFVEAKHVYRCRFWPDQSANFLITCKHIYQMDWHVGLCADPENSIKGPENIFFIIVFHGGPYRPPSRSNWTRTSISKEHITCDFPGGGGPVV